MNSVIFLCGVCIELNQIISSDENYANLPRDYKLCFSIFRDCKLQFAATKSLS